MNEFENLEAELKSLQPLSPSNDLKLRMENALGNAGKLAMRQMPGEAGDASASKFTNIPPKKNLFSQDAYFYTPDLPGLVWRLCGWHCFICPASLCQKLNHLMMFPITSLSSLCPPLQPLALVKTLTALFTV